MGSFLFKWPHAATEVFVTGTFDDWARSEKLEKKDGIWQKFVELPQATDKIYYKFVVDENWTTDHTAPTEKDENGNINNVLLPEHIIKKSTGTVGGATSDLPGAFPETPAPTSENQAFSVNPIPATAGIGNPVTLRPGEKVPDPSTLTSNTVQSTATTSKEAFEKSPSGAPVLPNPITPAKDQGTGLFGLPEQTKNMIPESSLPIGTGAATEAEKDPGVMISGGGGAPSTAALAGAVPLEPRGHAEVVDSGASNLATTSTGGGPTTAALAAQVPVEPRGTASTVDSSAFGSSGAPVTTSTGGGATTAALAGEVPLEPRGVPEVVRDSQTKAGVGPEASANPEAVLEKSAVEKELGQTVHTEPAVAGDPKPHDKVYGILGGATAAVAAAGATAAVYANKAKESVQSGEAQKSAQETAGQAKDTAVGYAGQAQSAATQAKDNAAPYAAQAKDTAAGYAAQAQESAAPYAAQAKDTAAAAATSVTATAAAAAASVKSALPESVQKSIDQMNTGSSLAGATDGTGNAPVAPQVPTTVKDSLAAAHAPAEAAVNPTQVSNKAIVEKELYNTVLPDQGIDEPPGSGVPPTVGASIAAAHASPEAAASKTAVDEKAQVENELLSTVKPAQSGGAPAPTISASTAETAPDALVVGQSIKTPLTAAGATGGKATTAPLDTGLNATAASAATTTTAAVSKPAAISRDVSPMTRPHDQTQPLATTGIVTGATPAASGPAASKTADGSVAPGSVGASATKTAGVQNPALAAAQQASKNPTQVAPASPASVQTENSGTSKSSKRRSLFGRIKDKVTHKRQESKAGESSQQ